MKLICMDNLLAAPEVRLYFKDLQSRFILVSAGPDSTVPSGQALEERIGKTDFDFYSVERATAFFEDEQEIIRSGKPIVEKLQRETFDNRINAWTSTSKMPLRNKRGEIIGTFGITRDVTAQIKAENALAYRVLHDPVTGLANRSALMDRLQQALLPWNACLVDSHFFSST
jgi:PAS domain-containing protein